MRAELLQVEMAYRCPLSWDDFHGDDQHRHCGTCNHTVTNLSEMTAAAAKDFLNQPKPGCVRFDSNRDGTLKTVDQQSRWPRFLKPVKFLLAGLMYFVTIGCKPKMGMPLPPDSSNEPTMGIPAIGNVVLGEPVPKKKDNPEDTKKQDQPDGASPDDKK